MMERSRLKSIQLLARSTLHEHGITELPVRPRSLAERLGISIMPFDPPSADISGVLMRVGNNFGIGYSTKIRNLGFQNFTVAHELGHYFIDGHLEAVLENGKHLSRSGYISKDRFEQEADAFATELLMPWAFLQPVIRAQPTGFSAINAISEACESSLLASAIRYCQLTDECVAVVVSHEGTVEFMTASSTFKQLPGIDWLKKRDLLPSGVPSARFASDPDWIAGCSVSEGGSLLSQWFPDASGLEVEEDVVGLGSYGRLLSVLLTEWNPEDEEEEESEKSDDYIERWKEGRFRGKK